MRKITVYCDNSKCTKSAVANTQYSVPDGFSSFKVRVERGGFGGSASDKCECECTYCDECMKSLGFKTPEKPEPITPDEVFTNLLSDLIENHLNQRGL